MLSLGDVAIVKDVIVLLPGSRVWQLCYIGLAFPRFGSSLWSGALHGHRRAVTDPQGTGTGTYYTMDGAFAS